MPFNLASILSPGSAKIAEVAQSAFDEPRFEFSDIIEGWHGAPIQDDDERREGSGNQHQEKQAEDTSRHEKPVDDDLTSEMGDKSARSANEGLPKDSDMPNPDGTGPVGPAILEGLVESPFSMAALEGAGFAGLESIESTGISMSPIGIDPVSLMI
jgi:hypothetical protein